MSSYTAPTIPVAPFRNEHTVDLVFRGVDQADPSYEGHVFLNNADANESTPRTPEAGYAGSFHVYGYGPHAPPAVAEARARREEGGGPVVPIEMQVRVDEAALHTALEKGDELTVTVVPVPVDPGGAAPERPFERVEVVFGRIDT
jgi:hypothetical protein